MNEKGYLDFYRLMTDGQEFRLLILILIFPDSFMTREIFAKLKSQEKFSLLLNNAQKIKKWGLWFQNNKLNPFTIFKPDAKSIINTLLYIDTFIKPAMNQGGYLDFNRLMTDDEEFKLLIFMFPDSFMTQEIFTKLESQEKFSLLLNNAQKIKKWSLWFQNNKLNPFKMFKSSVKMIINELLTVDSPTKQAEYKYILTYYNSFNDKKLAELNSLPGYKTLFYLLSKNPSSVEPATDQEEYFDFDRLIDNDKKLKLLIFILAFPDSSMTQEIFTKLESQEKFSLLLNNAQKIKKWGLWFQNNKLNPLEMFKSSAKMIINELLTVDSPIKQAEYKFILLNYNSFNDKKLAELNSLPEYKTLFNLLLSIEKIPN